MLIWIPLLFLACSTTKPVKHPVRKVIVHHHDQAARQAIIEVLKDEND